MKFLPADQLAYFNSAPQTHLHNLSGIPVSVFSAATLKYRENCGQTFPNDEAVSFYTLNHCASIVRKTFTEHEPLPEWAQWIMATYTDVCMKQGERMLHYILSITTRETRHLKSCTTAFWSKVTAEYGPQGVSLLKDISSNGNEDTAVNKYMKHPPNMTVGEYTKVLAHAFHKAGTSGWSGGYGGHPWGNVTDAVISYLSGVTSMEMLVDTGYTLAHNGGPIFNKGMMYSHYDGHFMTILDVQRAGQLLDLMVESNTLGVKKTAEAVKAVGLIQAHCPKDHLDQPTVKGFVDWKLVDEFRPEKDKQSNPGKYLKQTTAQKQPITKKPSVKKPVVVTSVMTTLAGKKVKMTGTFQVFPHQTVTIVTRVE